MERTMAKGGNPTKGRPGGEARVGHFRTLEEKKRRKKRTMKGETDLSRPRRKGSPSPW